MTSESPSTQQAPPRKRRRRRILLLSIPLVTIIVGWQVVERLIDIERFRPVIDKELELLIELPISFEAMDLKIFPTPRLVVQNVTVGEGDFRAFSPRVSVTADLGKLVRRQLDLRTVSINELSVHLPESNDDFIDRWRAYMLDLATPDGSGGKPMIRVTLNAIEAKALKIVRGDAVFAVGDLTVTDVTTRAPVFSFNGEGVGVYGSPKAEGAFALTVDEDPVLDGEAKLTHLPLKDLTGEHLLPAFLLDGDLDYQLSQDNQFSWEADGVISQPYGAMRDGTYRLKGNFGEEGLRLEDMDIHTEPVAFKGGLEIPSGTGWSLAIVEADLAGLGVDWLLRYVPELPVRPNREALSTCRLEHMNLGVDATGVFVIGSGVVRTEGVDLVVDSPSFVVSGLRSHISITDYGYEIRDISSDFINASGMLRINDDETYTLELSGQGYLGPAFPLPPALRQTLRLDGGTVDLQQFSTVLVNGQPKLEETQLSADLRDGAVALWDRSQEAFVPLDGIAGLVHLENGAIRLERLATMKSEVTGTVTPDALGEHWSFEGSLKSDLSSPVWKPLYPYFIAGALDLPALSGSYSRVDGAFSELNIEGTMSDVQLTLPPGPLEDTFTFRKVNLTTKEGAIAYDLSGQGKRWGKLGARGSYAPATRVLDTAVTIQAAALAQNAMSPTYWEDFGPLLEAHVSSTTVQIQYDGKIPALTFKSEEPMLFYGAAQLSPQGTVGEVTAVADLPVDWFAETLPDGVVATGIVETALRFKPVTGDVEATLNFNEAVVQWHTLKKETGFKSLVEVSGRWADDGVQDITGRVLLGESTIPFRWDGNGMSTNDINLSLEEFAPLLQSDAALSGQLTGSYSPGKLNLRLVGATMAATENQPAVVVNGEVLMDGAAWQLNGLALSLGDQQAMLTLNNQSGAWAGDLQSPALSIDQVQTDYTRLMDWWTPPTTEDTTGAADADGGAYSGEVALSIDSLTWGDATLGQLTGKLTMKPEELTLSNLQIKRGEGLTTGTINRRYGRDGALDQVQIDLVLLAVDLGQIEELLIEDSRDMHGLVDGRVVLAMPIPKDDTPLHHVMDGKIDFSAHDGTLGKAGLASKFLTALRTTDILRMRIPSLRDKGVTFERLAGELSVEAGVFTLSRYEMEDSTYALDAELVLDFPKDAASGTMGLLILEGVTGVASRIPILGEAAELVNKAFGVELRISGPASDPVFRASSLGPIKSMGNGARNLLRGTQKLVD